MPKYAALLRGISPNGPNMGNAYLRGTVESLGFTHVKTVISSGNVLFESPSKDVAAMQQRIEDAIFSQLGFHSTTIIRSERELQALVHADPFKGKQHSQATYLTVTFLKQPVKMAAPQPWMEGEGYKVVARYPGEICVVTDISTTKTPNIMGLLEKNYGKDITTRTIKTVERILKAFAA